MHIFLFLLFPLSMVVICEASGKQLYLLLQGHAGSRFHTTPPPDISSSVTRSAQLACDKRDSHVGRNVANHGTPIADERLIDPADRSEEMQDPPSRANPPATYFLWDWCKSGAGGCSCIRVSMLKRTPFSVSIPPP
ncbi:hypothetical protein LY78DRAFT_174560 [Colletotrichum sublineola]|nr:hypothetical protein LY78DRAFT_174560 [Colletotrichum sublineola]